MNETNQKCCGKMGKCHSQFTLKMKTTHANVN